MFKTTNPYKPLSSGRPARSALLLSAVLLGIYLGWRTYHTYQVRPARQRALQAAEAFFSVDYQDQGGWITDLCALSTPQGCRYLAEILAPALWADFQRNRTLSRASAQSAAQIHQFNTSNHQAAGIWQVGLHLDQAWPQDPDGRREFKVFVLLFRSEPGSWLFERILADDEIERLLP